MLKLLRLLIIIFLPVLLFSNNMTPDKLKKINETVAKLEKDKAQIPKHMQKIDDFVFTRYNNIKADMDKGIINRKNQIAAKFSDKSAKRIVYIEVFLKNKLSSLLKQKIK